MLFGGGIFGLAVLALWAYCIFDVIRTDESSIQNLPKMVWLLIVAFLGPIGSIAWLILGRPAGAGWELREPQARRRPLPDHQTGLPDAPRPSSTDHAIKREEALRKYMAEREADLRKREEEVRRLEQELLRKNRPADDAPDDPSSGSDPDQK